MQSLLRPFALAYRADGGKDEKPPLLAFGLTLPDCKLHRVGALAKCGRVVVVVAAVTSVA